MDYIHINEHVKYFIDTLSISTVLATLTAWLPPIAALLSIIWTAMRIYEMVSGKEIAGRKLPRKPK
jgi:hypothetical protein